MEELLFVQLVINITGKNFLIASVLLNMVFILWIFILYSSRKNSQLENKNFHSTMDYDSTRNRPGLLQSENSILKLCKEKEIECTNLEKKIKDLIIEIASLKSQIEEFKVGTENDSKIIDDLKFEMEEMRKGLNKTFEVENNPSYMGIEESLFKSNEDSNELAFAKCEVIDEAGYLEKTKNLSHQTPYFIENCNGKIQFYLNNKNKDAIANALNFYNVYIRAFCESDNIYNPSIHKSFIAEENSKGLLEKEGDKFRVIEKLKIKFLEQ